MKPNRKGILMLCYYYPPIKSMGVMRSYALSHEWLKYFEKVHIITTSNRSKLQQEILPIDNEIAVECAATFDYRSLSSVFSNQSHYSESSKKSFLGQFIVKLLNSFPFNLIIGEGGWIYTYNAYRKAVRLISKYDIRYLYSSFRPYSDHQIASKLKRKFPHLVWLADFRDIHVDVLKQNVFFETYQHRMNRSILQKADLVTTVSQGCANHIEKYKKQVHVIHNGVRLREVKQWKLHEQFTITYTGSLYGEMRNPSLVFEVLRDLISEDYFQRPIRIVYAGKDSDAWSQWIDRYDLRPFMIDEGLCSVGYALELQRNSHMNLQLTFAHPEVTGAITGKVMEYVQAGRPILCLINGSQDKEIESFFNRVNSSVVAYNTKQDKLQIKRFICEYYQYYLSQEVSKFEIEQPLLKELNWTTLGRKYVNLIDEIGCMTTDE